MINKDSVFISLLKKHTNIDTKFINTFFKKFKIGGELNFDIKDKDIAKFLILYSDNGIPRKLASKPWVGILAGSNGKMISKNKTLASNLIAWYLIGDRIGAKLVNELEDGWREINGGYPLPTPKN